MAVSDFIFQGAAPVPTPTGSDTTTNFPLWLQTEIYDTANAAINLAGTPYTPFPGSQVAQPSNQTQQAWNLAGKNVGSWQPSLNTAGGALGAASGLTQASGAPITSADINQFLNPYTQDVVQGLETASNQNFAQNVLPQIRDQFVSAGQAASPQQAEQDARAAYLQSQALNPAIANALQQGYSGALSGAFGQKQQEAQAGAQLGTLGAEYGQLGALGSQLGSYDVANLAAAGNAQDVLSQENINAAMRNFQNQVQWPFQTLGYASNIIRGLPVPTTQQSVQTQFPPAFGPSPASTALGTAALASSLGVGAAKGGHVGALARGLDHHDEDQEWAEDEAEDKRLVTKAIHEHDDFAHEGHHTPLHLARGGALSHYAEGGDYGENERSVNQDEMFAKALLGLMANGSTATAPQPAGGALPHLPPIEQRRPDLYRTRPPMQSSDASEVQTRYRRGGALQHYRRAA